MYIAEMALLGVAIGVALAWIAIAIASGPPRQRVAQVESNIARVDSGIDEVRSDINKLRGGFAELRVQIDETNRRIEETNRILVGLANHRHDTDGTTVFTVPQP